jgi:hypothetical protein
MTDAQKQKIKRILRFKQQHVNALVMRKLTFKKREKGNLIFEDIFFDGKKIAHFKHDGINLTFEEVSRPSNRPLSQEELNSLPQS